MDPYILPRIISFSSADKRAQFIDALRFVINRHDVLRTCVLSEGFSQALQVVLRQVELSVEQLSVDSSQDILPQVEQEIAPAHLHMDLTTAPLLRVKVADDVANEAYYLVLHNHHLVIDHIGMAKVGEEIMMYLSGQAGLLPKPSLYRHYIGDTLNKDKLAKSKEYFSGLYAGIDTPTYPFNLSNTKIDGKTDLVSSQTMLSTALRDGIRKVSGDLQMSPAVLFHAAFGLAVGRCSNTDYALFGTVLLGRLQGSKGSESSLGLFMNTLPMLLSLSGDVPAYISQANERLQALINYEQTPLSKIHQMSGISNDMPMLSALLNYRHSTSGESIEALAMDGELLAGEQRTNFPFNLEVDDYGDDFGLTATLVDIGIAPATVLYYMTEALSTLLEGIDSMPVKGMEELSIVPTEEKNQLLEVFNDTEVSYPTDKTVVDLIEEQVKATPGAIAVIYEGESLSYQELDERSNQLAHYLVERGIGPGALVGICLGRSLEMLAGILGVLKAGGAYVPIGPDYPQSRIDYILEDTGAEALLTAGNGAGRFAGKGHLQVIALDRDWDKIAKAPVKKLKRVASPEHLAYVIYTSGSTGKPKGVPIAHASLLNFLQGIVGRLEMKGLATLLSVTTYTFDIFYLELFAPLLLGAKVVVLDTPSTKDGNQLQKAIEDYQPDFMQATPSTWQMLVDNGWENKEGVTVLTGGEAINEALKNSLTAISPTVWNLYGPTEATIWVTAQQLKQSESVNIGKAINNVLLYVLDDNNLIVPTGVVGELCIGGPQLSQGYLNKASLTKEKFVPNPFKAGGRIYKTGDLARWLPDGSIELIGRKDSQVKVRGYRIELGEIENNLSLVPGIQQCCVLATDDGHGGKQLIGYVTMEGELDKPALQQQLQLSLPEYMVPRLWVQLDEMPLTANGKLDRKALPALDGSVLSGQAFVAPRTEMEEQMASIWQDLLQVEKVGVHDNFFELGGHSLLVTRLVSMIRIELDIEIAIRDLFKFSTVEELSAYLEYKVVHFNDALDESSMINIEL